MHGCLHLQAVFQQPVWEITLSQHKEQRCGGGGALSDGWSFLWPYCYTLKGHCSGMWLGCEEPRELLRQQTTLHLIKIFITQCKTLWCLFWLLYVYNMLRLQTRYVYCILQVQTRYVYCMLWLQTRYVTNCIILHPCSYKQETFHSV